MPPSGTVLQSGTIVEAGRFAHCRAQISSAHQSAAPGRLTRCSHCFSPHSSFQRSCEPPAFNVQSRRANFQVLCTACRSTARQQRFAVSPGHRWYVGVPPVHLPHLLRRARQSLHHLGRHHVPHCVVIAFCCQWKALKSERGERLHRRLRRHCRDRWWTVCPNQDLDSRSLALPGATNTDRLTGLFAVLVVAGGPSTRHSADQVDFLTVRRTVQTLDEHPHRESASQIPTEAEAAPWIPQMMLIRITLHREAEEMRKSNDKDRARLLVVALLLGHIRCHWNSCRILRPNGGRASRDYRDTYDVGPYRTPTMCTTVIYMYHKSKRHPRYLREAAC